MKYSYSDKQIAMYKEWVKKNYKPFTKIEDYWHQIVQYECQVINMEQAEEEYKYEKESILLV